MVFRPKEGFDYLLNKPKRINWKIVAGEELSKIQMYDLVFDDYDLKIRQIAKTFKEL